MKNIFKRALALTMVSALFAVSALAAPTISGVNYDSSTGKLSATVSGYTPGDDATILVLKKGATLATAQPEDIVYINQVETDSEGKYTYSVPVKERAAALGASDINLYVGGENITTAVAYGGSTATDISVPNDTPATKKQVSYTSEWVNSALTYDSTLEDAALKTAIKANIKVKKVTDGTAADLATDKWDVAVDKTAKTATVTVTETLASDEELATGASVTLTALSFNWTSTVTPEPSGKTGIKGVVKRRVMGANYSNAPAALVIVANGTTIVGTAVTDADGNFEVEVPAGTYRVIVRFGLLSDTAVTNYANTSFADVVVADGAMKTLTTDSKEFIAVERRLSGDANDDGAVTTADLDAVLSGLAS